MNFSSNDLFQRRISLKPDLTTRDKAIASWVEAAAGKGGVPYDRAYDADVRFGHCLLALDGSRMHMDWYINTLPFSPLPERYNEEMNLMIDLLDECQRTVIHAEHELAQVEAAIMKHLQPQTEPEPKGWRRFVPFVTRAGRSARQYRFPFLPLTLKTGERIPEILVNYHYLRMALTGFSGQVTFWYPTQEPDKMPVAFGTPGQRLAIIMPAALN